MRRVGTVGTVGTGVVGRAVDLAGRGGGHRVRGLDRDPGCRARAEAPGVIDDAAAAIAGLVTTRDADARARALERGHRPARTDLP